MTLTLRPLCGLEKEHLQVKKSDAFYYFGNTYSLSIVSRGRPYHIPQAKNFASIDSFYFELASDELPFSAEKTIEDFKKDENRRLVLFQMTQAKTHPVNGIGLVNVLTHLKLLEIVRANPKKVALIFVVPEENAADFQRQPIEAVELAQDAGVQRIKGIGTKMGQKLREDKIYTIADLERALLEKTWSDTRHPRVRVCVENHREAAGVIRTTPTLLASIPQFVSSIK